MSEITQGVAPARQDVLDRLRGALPGILAGQPVLLAYLYGSVAEGYALPGSDVDVALVLAPSHGLSAYQRMQMELRIAAELEARCGLPQADVRSVNDAPVMAQGTVVTEGVLVYSCDEDFRADFEVLTRKRYFDFLPVARMMQRAYFEHMGADLRRQGLLPDG
jgi:predicted nucleotidyltransferase